MSNDNKNKQNKPGMNGRGPKGNKNLMLIVVGVLVLMMVSSVVSRSLLAGSGNEITYNEFLELLRTKEVEEVVFDEMYNRVTAKIKAADRLEKAKIFTAAIVDKEAALEIINERGITYKGTVVTSTSWISMLIYGVMMAFFFYMIISMRKGGGIMGNMGKNTAKVYVQKETGVTFLDVAGQDEATESLVEMVDFLHNPGRYVDIGAKLPKGALLVGPPGTGKTLLAKAVAGEAKVPFFSLAGSDFVEMFVGMGASRVRSLFKEAQQMAPCIIFIDEIDAIGKTRDARYGGNDEREQTLNALLAEMDGFDSSKGVFILAATNRPEVLDPALLRPGRLDRRIIVDKPDLKGRLSVLKVHAKNVNLDDTVDLDEIALATSGAVGSDLANMINEAAILAVKQGRKAVSQADLFESVEVVIAGKEKKDRIMNDKEKKMVAYHEVGHALVAALQKNTEPVQKITIVPRTMGTLGYVMQTPEEEKYLMTKVELEAELVTLLAGRASEELYFESVSTGASNDIEKATKIARSMVTRFGMSEEFGLMGLETVESRYLDGRAYMNCSDATAGGVDEVVKRMLAQAYQKSKEYLSGNKNALDRIASYLIEKETITGKEFMSILDLVRREEEAAREQEEPVAVDAPAAVNEPVAADEPVEADAPEAAQEPELSGENQ